MDTVAAVGVAKALGVSLPTAHRALDRAGVARVSRGHTRTASAHILAELLRQRGATPQSDRSAAELKIMVALRESNSGYPSARAIAARVRISPTTAVSTLRHLRDEGLVEWGPVILAGRPPVTVMRWRDTGVLPTSLIREIAQTTLPLPRIVRS